MAAFEVTPEAVLRRGVEARRAERTARLRIDS
jgi:hypothetical protein